MSNELMKQNWEQLVERHEFRESVIHNTILFYIMYRATNPKQRMKLVPPFWILLGLHFLEQVLATFDESYEFADIWKSWLTRDRATAATTGDLNRLWNHHFGLQFDDSFNCNNQIQIPVFKPYFGFQAALECYETLTSQSRNHVRFTDPMIRQLLAKNHFMDILGINPGQLYTVDQLPERVQLSIPFLNEDKTGLWDRTKVRRFLGSYTMLDTIIMTCMSDTEHYYSGHDRAGGRVFLTETKFCTLPDIEWRMNGYGQIEFVAHPDLVLVYHHQLMGLVLEQKVDCNGGGDMEAFIRQLWVMETSKEENNTLTVRTLLNTWSAYLTVYRMAE